MYRRSARKTARELEINRETVRKIFKDQKKVRILKCSLKIEENIF
jgi:DNA invertase Pin-like site-specific DNA recombinase